MATSRTPILIAVPLLLIESTLLTVCFAFMSQNLLPLAKSEKPRLRKYTPRTAWMITCTYGPEFAVALVISCSSIVFTVGVGVICLDYGMETSELACEVTYILCAIFWLAIKSLVCLYFYEKVDPMPLQPSVLN